MTQGRLIAVVGPSGVGKDSVMAGIKRAMPAMHLVRRVITRAPDLGGEDYEAVTVSVFEKLARKGAFAVHWALMACFMACLLMFRIGWPRVRTALSISHERR